MWHLNSLLSKNDMSLLQSEDENMRIHIQLSKDKTIGESEAHGSKTTDKVKTTKQYNLQIAIQ
jgi:hypothetical protein